MARRFVPRVTWGTGVIFTSRLAADACATELLEDRFGRAEEPVVEDDVAGEPFGG